MRSFIAAALVIGLACSAATAAHPAITHSSKHFHVIPGAHVGSFAKRPTARVATAPVGLGVGGGAGFGISPAVYGGYGSGYGGYNNWPAIGSINISTPYGMEYGTYTTIGNATSGQYYSPTPWGGWQSHGFYQYKIPGGGIGGWSW